jgi:hypothetical protein
MQAIYRYVNYGMNCSTEIVPLRLVERADAHLISQGHLRSCCLKYGLLDNYGSRHGDIVAYHIENYIKYS